MAKTHREVLTRLLAAFVSLVLVGGLLACGGSSQEDASADGQGEPVEIRLGYIEGTASLGLVPLMEKARAGETSCNYSIALLRDHDEAQMALEQNMVDIALIYPTKAAIAYHNSNGNVLVADVAQTANWTLVTRNKAVKRLEGLVGRNVYSSAKMGAQGIVLRYLLELKGLSDQVVVEYRSTDTEVASDVLFDASCVGFMSEPYISKTQLNNENVNCVTTANDEWKKLVADGSQAIGLVVAVRREFASAHPDLLEEFLAEQASSVEEMTIDPISHTDAAIEFGLLAEEDAELCKSIVDNSSLTCITGADMRTALEGYLLMFAEKAPDKIGMSMPGDDFFMVDVHAVTPPVATETAEGTTEAAATPEAEAPVQN